MKNRGTVVLFLLLIVATLWLRIACLGYSNFQGDEIKAMFRPQDGENIKDFLFSQRKGPVQFLITGIYSVIDPLFSSEFFLRFPFALSGIFSVLVFYGLVRLYFGTTIAICASFLMATNGLFVAFGRIVQYQSITILCSLLCLYFLSSAMKGERWRVPALYAGLLSASVGILSHFDGIFIIPPTVYLLCKLYKQSKKPPGLPGLRRHIFYAVALATLPVLIFYIPYVIYVTYDRIVYWSERISGPPSHSMTSFQFYNPIIGIHVYGVLLVLSLFRIKQHKDAFLFVLWLLPPFIFMEFVMQSPRTHIYTYLLPSFVFAAMGIETIEIGIRRFFSKKSVTIVHIACSVLFLFLFSVSHTLFVDHQKEYPWTDKDFFRWKLRGHYMEGIMGFPYNRQWREIGHFFSDNYKSKEQFYATNEKHIISSFYLPKHMTFCENEAVVSQQLMKSNGFFMIIVENPQSWEQNILGRPVNYWKNLLVPLKTFADEHKNLLSSVYYLSRADLDIAMRH